MTSYEFFCSLEDYSLEDVMVCFVEEYKNYRHEARLRVLRDEPIRFRGTREERAFYAALCEFYSNWYHLPQPEWLFKEEYYLNTEFKPFNKNANLADSPMEFKKRNIAIGKNDVVLA